MTQSEKDVLIPIGSLALLIILVALVISPPWSKRAVKISSDDALNYDNKVFTHVAPIDCSNVARVGISHMDVRNLCEQRSIAESTQKIVITTYVQISVGILTLIFLFLTFRAQRNELMLAKEAIELSHAGENPYVMATYSAITDPENPLCVLVKVGVKNFGKTPAIDVTVSTAIVVRRHGNDIGAIAGRYMEGIGTLSSNQEETIYSQSIEIEAFLDRNPSVDADIFCVLANYHSVFSSKNINYRENKKIELRDVNLGELGRNSPIFQGEVSVAHRIDRYTFGPVEKGFDPQVALNKSYNQVNNVGANA